VFIKGRRGGRKKGNKSASPEVSSRLSPSSRGRERAQRHRPLKEGEKKTTWREGKESHLVDVAVGSIAKKGGKKKKNRPMIFIGERGKKVGGGSSTRFT